MSIIIPQSSNKLISNSASKSTTIIKTHQSKINKNKNQIDYGIRSMLEKANLIKNNNKLLKDKEKRHSLINKSSIFEFYNNLLQESKSKAVIKSVSVLNIKNIEKKEVPYMKYLKQANFRKEVLLKKAFINKNHTDVIKQNNDFIISVNNDMYSKNNSKYNDYNKHIMLKKSNIKYSFSSIYHKNNSNLYANPVQTNKFISSITNQDLNYDLLKLKQIHRNVLNINSNSLNNLNNIDVYQSSNHSNHSNFSLSSNNKTYSTNYFYEFPIPKLYTNAKNVNDSKVLYAKKAHRFRNTLYFYSNK